MKLKANRRSALCDAAIRSTSLAPKSIAIESGHIQTYTQVMTIATVMKLNDLRSTSLNVSLSPLPTWIEPNDWMVRQTPDRKRL